jgi:hypothetical protein
MKKIEFAEYGGSLTFGALNSYLLSSKAPAFINKVPDADLWLGALVIAGDVLMGDRMYGWLGESLDGAAVYEAGHITDRLLSRVFNGAGGTTTSSSSTGTSASVYAPRPSLAAPKKQVFDALVG